MTDKTDLKNLVDDLKDLKGDLNNLKSDLKRDLKGIKTDIKMDLDTLDELLIKNQAKKIKIHTTQNNGKFMGDQNDPIPYYTFYEVNGKLFLSTKNTDKYIYAVKKINFIKKDEYTTNLDVFTISEKGYTKNTMENCVATEFDKLNHYIKKKHMIAETQKEQPLLLGKNPIYKHSLPKGQTTLADFQKFNLPPPPPKSKNNNRPKDETTLDMFTNDQTEKFNFNSADNSEIFARKDPNEIFASNLGINGNKGNASENFFDENNFENIPSQHFQKTPDFAATDIDLDENSTDFAPDDEIFEDEEKVYDDHIFEDDNFTIPTNKNAQQTQSPSPNATEKTVSDPQNIKQPEQVQEKLTPENSPEQFDRDNKNTLPTQEKSNTQPKAEETEKETPAPKEKKKRELWKNVYKDTVDVGMQIGSYIALVLCVAGVFAPFIAGWVAIAAVVIFALRDNIIGKLEEWVKDIAKGAKAEKEKSKEKAKIKAQAKAEKKAKKAQKKSDKQLAKAEKNAVKSKDKAQRKSDKLTKNGKVNKKIKGIETDYSPIDVNTAPYAKDYKEDEGYVPADYTPIKDKGFGNELSEEEIARQEKIINANKSEPLMPKNVLPKAKINEEGDDYGTPNYDLDNKKPIKEVKEKDINVPQNEEMKCFEEEDIELEEQEKPKTEEQERQEIREKTRDLHHGEQLPLNEQHKLYGSKIAIKDNPLDLPKSPKQKEEDHSQGM